MSATSVRCSRLYPCVSAESTHFATLPRKRLDDWILKRCMKAGARVHDHMRLTSIDEGEHMAVCEDLRSKDIIRIRYGTLTGADGAGSMVRYLLDGSRQHLLTGEIIDVPVKTCHQGILWFREKLRCE